MEFFDCHVEFGRRPVPATLQAEQASDLLALYTEIGIGRAMVLHAAQRFQHPAVGNTRLLAEIAGCNALTPAWVMLPPCTEELGTPEAFIEQMRQAKVAALWAFPREHRYLLDVTSCGSLLELLRDLHIPLFVSGHSLGDEPGRWRHLGELLREMPGLRLVCCPDGIWGEDRFFRPLLDRFPDLHLCLCHYMLEGGYEALYQRYGAERFLFGTAFPDMQPGGAQMALLHAGLPDAATTAIAGGNLQRLLREVKL